MRQTLGGPAMADLTQHGLPIHLAGEGEERLQEPTKGSYIGSGQDADGIKGWQGTHRDATAAAEKNWPPQLVIAFETGDPSVERAELGPSEEAAFHQVAAPLTGQTSTGSMLQLEGLVVDIERNFIGKGADMYWRTRGVAPPTPQDAPLLLNCAYTTERHFVRPGQRDPLERLEASLELLSTGLVRAIRPLPSKPQFWLPKVAGTNMPLLMQPDEKQLLHLIDFGSEPPSLTSTLCHRPPTRSSVPTEFQQTD